MTSRDFCYWLQGHFEISDAKKLDEKGTAMIKRHLAMVFKHEIDPSFPDRKELSGIHNPPKGIRGLIKASKKKKEIVYCGRNRHETPIMC